MHPARKLVRRMVGRPQRSHTGRAEVAQEVLQRSRNVAQRSRRGPVEVAQRSRKGRAKEAVWDKIQRGGPNLTQSGGRPVQRSPLPGSAGVEVPQRSRRHPPEVPQRSQRGPPQVPQNLRHRSALGQNLTPPCCIKLCPPEIRLPWDRI